MRKPYLSKASPTRLKLYTSCIRKYVLTYIQRVDVEAKAKSAVSKTLGVIVHKLFERWVGKNVPFSVPLERSDFTSRELAEINKAATLLAKQRNEDVESKSKKITPSIEELFARAPAIAMSGMPFLPVPSEVLSAHVEQALDLKVTGYEDVEWSEYSRLDLIVQALNGEWFVYDYKTTKGSSYGGKHDPWAYVPAAQELKFDVQVLSVAVAAMCKYKLNSIWVRFIYLHTGDGTVPVATPRDVYLTLEEATPLLANWLEIAREIRAFERNPAPLESLPYPQDLLSQDSPCRSFGGCSFKSVACFPPEIDALKAQVMNQNNQQPGVPMQYNPNVNPFASMTQPQPQPPVQAPPQPQVRPENQYVQNRDGSFTPLAVLHYQAQLGQPTINPFNPQVGGQAPAPAYQPSSPSGEQQQLSAFAAQTVVATPASASAPTDVSVPPEPEKVRGRGRPRKGTVSEVKAPALAANAEPLVVQEAPSNLQDVPRASSSRFEEVPSYRAAVRLLTLATGDEIRKRVSSGDYSAEIEDLAALHEHLLAYLIKTCPIAIP